MPRFTFKPEDLRMVLSLARVVKPETKDLSFTFSSESLVVFSFDKRRYSCARVPVQAEGAADGWVSSEFYITLDRTALFESDLTSISVTVNDKSLVVNATDGDQARMASLKRRSVRSRRPPVPRLPPVSFLDVGTADMDALLSQVSCSAMVKETKTEEEMRVHQVHFYGESGHVCSTARYHGSVARLDGLSLDVSVVSSDIPMIKSFCSRIPGDVVRVGHDGSHLYFNDPVTGSFMALSRVSSRKPPVSSIDPSGFKTVLVADQAQLLKNLGWAQLAIEGTQRISFRAQKSNDGDAGELELLHGLEEVSRFPVRFLKGSALSADFPVRFLHSIVKHVDGDVVMGFDHPEAPKVLGVYSSNGGPIHYAHYLMSMISR